MECSLASAQTKVLLVLRLLHPLTDGPENLRPSAVSGLDALTLQFLWLPN